MIGVDPHKASVTIEVRDRREVLRATGRFPMDKTGYRQPLGYVRQWPRRTWAVEGAHGVGRPLASRLLADGEAALDVPAKLAARVRVFDTGQGRKTDATYAHAVAVVALRTRGLRQLVVDGELARCDEGCSPMAYEGNYRARLATHSSAMTRPDSS
jgi:hypothetical protein